MADSICRVKFKCRSVTDHGEGKKSVIMNPVTGEKSENQKFWDATPSGEFQMAWINANLKFTAGKDYYLDVSEA